MTQKISKLIVIVMFIYISHHSANVEAKLLVFVSLLPQQESVQQIGKDMVDVHVMVAPGANPATYPLKPNWMANLWRVADQFSAALRQGRIA